MNSVRFAGSIVGPTCKPESISMIFQFLGGAIGPIGSSVGLIDCSADSTDKGWIPQKYAFSRVFLGQITFGSSHKMHFSPQGFLGFILHIFSSSNKAKQILQRKYTNHISNLSKTQPISLMRSMLELISKHKHVHVSMLNQNTKMLTNHCLQHYLI